MKDKLIAAGQYLLDRAKEASTWRGLVLIATTIGGVSVPEDKAGAIVLIGLGVAGVLGAAFPDKRPPKE